MGFMLRPATRISAALSFVATAIILLCFLWWADHERLARENESLRLKLQSAEERLREYYRNRGPEKLR